MQHFKPDFFVCPMMNRMIEIKWHFRAHQQIYRSKDVNLENTDFFDIALGTRRIISLSVGVSDSFY